MSTHADLSDSLVKVIKRRRVAKKVTMYRIAKLCGLDKSTLGKLEAGKRVPSVDTADRIARALGTSLSRIVKEAENLRGNK